MTEDDQDAMIEIIQLLWRRQEATDDAITLIALSLHGTQEGGKLHGIFTNLTKQPSLGAEIKALARRLLLALEHSEDAILRSCMHQNDHTSPSPEALRKLFRVVDSDKT